MNIPSHQAKVCFLVLAERDAQDRLSGVIFQEDQFRAGSFSGTLELLRVMDELVPPQRPAHEAAGGAGQAAGPGSAPEPARG